MEEPCLSAEISQITLQAHTGHRERATKSTRYQKSISTKVSILITGKLERPKRKVVENRSKERRQQSSQRMRFSKSNGIQKREAKNQTNNNRGVYITSRRIFSERTAKLREQARMGFKVAIARGSLTSDGTVR